MREPGLPPERDLVNSSRVATFAARGADRARVEGRVEVRSGSGVFVSRSTGIASHGPERGLSAKAEPS